MYSYLQFAVSSMPHPSLFHLNITPLYAPPPCHTPLCSTSMPPLYAPPPCHTPLCSTSTSHPLCSTSMPHPSAPPPCHTPICHTSMLHLHATPLYAPHTGKVFCSSPSVWPHANRGASSPRVPAAGQAGHWQTTLHIMPTFPCSDGVCYHTWQLPLPCHIMQ